MNHNLQEEKEKEREITDDFGSPVVVEEATPIALEPCFLLRLLLVLLLLLRQRKRRNPPATFLTFSSSPFMLE